MPEVTRRRLLSCAVAGAGGVLASSMLPPALARAAAEGPRPGSLRDVKHVVIHMQENRSFDHYFGTLAGVAGFGDPNALVQTDPTPPFTQLEGKSIFYQYDPYNPDGYLLPWHLDTRSTSAQAIPSTSHAWTYQHESLNITVPTTPGAPTTALNNNWIPTHFTADGAANYWYVMGYYERHDIPFHFALAETFTLCDHYHCSLLGPTWPNRMFLWSGTIDPTGANGGPITSNVVPSPVTGQPYTWKTYPERLTEAGITWRVYQEEDDYGTNMLEFFAAYQNAGPGDPLYEGGLTIYPPDRFEWEAKHDKLPTVSWIVPTSGQSEHPAYLPASGANYLASKLNAVAENRDLWSKTVFIVNYDENDGLFDHVVPPLPPAGTPDEFVQIPKQPNWPIGGGVRVPCFIVSPWTVGGYVASEQFDHTSVLQFLERLTGVQETNISAWRRETFGDLTSALGFSNGKATTFGDLTSALGFSNGKATTFPPHLPATIGRFWEAADEVETLPAPTIPGGRPDPAGAGETASGGAVATSAQPPARARGGASPARRDQPLCREPHDPPRRLQARRQRHGLPEEDRRGREQACGCRPGDHVRLRAGDRRRQRHDLQHRDACPGLGDHRQDHQSVRGGRDPGRQPGVGDRVGHQHGQCHPDSGQHSQRDHRHDRRRDLSPRDRDHAGRHDRLRGQHRTQHRPRWLGDGVGHRRLDPDSHRNDRRRRGAPGGHHLA
jgi:phospholipase C